MRIRAEHLDLLTGSLLVERAAQYLVDNAPGATEVPVGDLRRGVAILVDKARRHGFASEFEIVSFVLAGYLMGEDFDTEFNVAREILADRDLTARMKAELLGAWCRRVFETLAEEE